MINWTVLGILTTHVAALSTTGWFQSLLHVCFIVSSHASEYFEWHRIYGPGANWDCPLLFYMILVWIRKHESCVIPMPTLESIVLVAHVQMDWFWALSGQVYTESVSKSAIVSEHWLHIHSHKDSGWKDIMGSRIHFTIHRQSLDVQKGNQGKHFRESFAFKTIFLQSLVQLPQLKETMTWCRTIVSI